MKDEIHASSNPASDSIASGPKREGLLATC